MKKDHLNQAMGVFSAEFKYAAEKAQIKHKKRKHVVEIDLVTIKRKQPIKEIIRQLDKEMHKLNIEP